MALLGIEFSDNLITGVRNGELLFTEPACALLTDSGILFGDAALKSARTQPAAFFDHYWAAMSEAALPRGGTNVQSCADLVVAQLEHIWREHGREVTGVYCAVSSVWDRQQLGLFLGLAEEAGIPVAGLAEIPIAATRREYPGHNLLHVELGRHATVLSTVTQEGAPLVSGSEALDNLGAAALGKACAAAVAYRFLRSSRFDPLHDANSEQALFDLLPGWLTELNRRRELTLALAYKDNRFTADISFGELAEALRPRYQPLVQSIRGRLRADHPTAVQLNSQFALYPGLAEALADLPGCDVFVLEQGAAARGLLERRGALAQPSGAIAIAKTLPWDRPPAEVSIERSMSSTTGIVPSHVVLGSRAWKLGAEPLRIGSEAVSGSYSLAVEAKHSAVSRQHCTIEIVDGRVTLTDYSRYGTRLNGYRVEGTAVLQAGDTVSLGEPPCELKLVAEVTDMTGRN